jgi:hypothetical protein
VLYHAQPPTSYISYSGIVSRWAIVGIGCSLFIPWLDLVIDG